MSDLAETAQRIAARAMPLATPYHRSVPKFNVNAATVNTNFRSVEMYRDSKLPLVDYAHWSSPLSAKVAEGCRHLRLSPIRLHQSAYTSERALLPRANTSTSKEGTGRDAGRAMPLQATISKGPLRIGAPTSLGVENADCTSPRTGTRPR